MNIQSIRDFYKLTRLKSISKLAAATNLSQPALSLQLQRLENEVGHTLFTRSNKGIELTEAGTIMENYAQRFASLYDSMMQEFEVLNNLQNVYRIFCAGGINTDVVVKAVAEAHRRFSQLFIVESCTDPDEIPQRVKNEKNSIGILPVHGSREEGVQYFPLYTDELKLFAGLGCSAAGQLTAHTLFDHPLYVLPDEHYLFRPVRSFLSNRRNVSLRQRAACVFDDTGAVKNALLQSGGLGFLLKSTVKEELASGTLREIALEGFSQKYELNLICTDSFEKDNSATLLLKYLIKQIVALSTPVAQPEETSVREGSA